MGQQQHTMCREASGGARPPAVAGASNDPRMSTYLLWSKARGRQGHGGGGGSGNNSARGACGAGGGRRGRRGRDSSSGGGHRRRAATHGQQPQAAQRGKHARRGQRRCTAQTSIRIRGACGTREHATWARRPCRPCSWPAPSVARSPRPSPRPLPRGRGHPTRRRPPLPCQAGPRPRRSTRWGVRGLLEGRALGCRWWGA